MYDMVSHLDRQAAFSRVTFGPGPRTKGVCDHVRKELVEVEKVYETRTCTIVTGYYFDPISQSRVEKTEEVPVESSPEKTHMGAAEEWTDVAILGLDGLMRAIWAAHPEWDSKMVALQAVRMITWKQGKNERRNWPDWRDAEPGKAIEHVRGFED